MRKVAIIGRPNVGKSTLFNRIVGQRRAIVEPTPGVTRDLNYAPASWRGRDFQLIDTGGWEEESSDPLRGEIRRAAERAAAEADLIILLVDGRDGLNPIESEIFNYLRSSSRPVLLAVNKLDSRSAEENLPEFFRLGAGEIFAISAEHGTAVGELLDAVVRHLPTGDAPEEETRREGETELKVAIVGRPNVGKSTLANRIVGEERVIVDDRPGTTRDPIDIPVRIEKNGQLLRLLLIDLAGIRRKSRVEDPIERASVHQALKSIRRADVALLVLDSAEAVEFSEDRMIIKLLAQEARLAEFIHQRGRGLILVINKWDLIEKKAQGRAFLGGRRDRDHWLDLSDLAKVSALTGQGLESLVDYLFRYRDVRRKISTSDLNLIIQRAVERHHPAAFRGREIRILYATQTHVFPQTFVIFSNHPQGITEDYQRYLANIIRDAYSLKGLPIRLKLRKKT